MPLIVMLTPTTASPGGAGYNSAIQRTILREGGQPAGENATFRTADGTVFRLNDSNFGLSHLSPSLCRIIFQAAKQTNSWISTPSAGWWKAKSSAGHLPDYGVKLGLPPEPEVASARAIPIDGPAQLCGRLRSALVEWNKIVRTSQAAGMMDADERMRMPPADPGTEERLTSDPSGVAARCAGVEAGEQRELKERVLSIVISRNAEWGVIWRADVVSADFPEIVTRQVCALQPVNKQALVVEDLPLDPLDPNSAASPLDPRETTPTK